MNGVLAPAHVYVRYTVILFPAKDADEAVLIGHDGAVEDSGHIVPLHPGHQVKFPVQFDGAGVHHRVHAQPFLEERIAVHVQIVAPEQRDVLPGQHGILVAMVDAVVKGIVHLIGAIQQLLLLLQFFFILRMYAHILSCSWLLPAAVYFCLPDTYLHAYVCPCRTLNGFLCM